MFSANAEVMVSKGNNILSSSNDFNANIDKIYQTVGDLIKNGYLSPAALAIAKEIESHRATLEDMVKVMDQYGNFLIDSGRTVTKNEETIIDEIN